MAANGKQTETRTIEAPEKPSDEMALQMTLARTHQAQAEAERSRTEAEIKKREMEVLSQVKMGPRGIQCDDLNGLWWLAKRYAEMENIPLQFRHRPADCLIAVEMGQRYGIHPKLFMEKCYVLSPGTDKEKRGMEAQLAIAMANNSGLLTGNIKYVLDDETNPTKCEAWAIMAGDGSRISYTVSIQDAKNAGWWEKKGRDGNDYSLWPKLTKLFLQYRSATYLIRTNIPEVLLGMLTTEEIKDIEPANGSMTPAARQAASDAIKTEAAKPATNRISEFTEKLKNGNGHKPAPVKTPPPEETNQEAGATQEEVTHAQELSAADVDHAKSNNGELPFGTEDQSAEPNKAEMFAGENPKPGYPPHDPVLKEIDEAMGLQKAEVDLRGLAGALKDSYGDKLTKPRAKIANELFNWHLGRINAMQPA